jgi:hypothetical protein
MVNKISIKGREIKEELNKMKSLTNDVRMSQKQKCNTKIQKTLGPILNLEEHGHPDWWLGSNVNPLLLKDNPN